MTTTTLTAAIAEHEQARDQARRSGDRRTRKFHAKAAIRDRRHLVALLRRRGETPHRPD